MFLFSPNTQIYSCITLMAYICVSYVLYCNKYGKTLITLIYTTNYCVCFELIGTTVYVDANQSLTSSKETNMIAAFGTERKRCKPIPPDSKGRG
jgi:hypothetical protein